MTIRPMRNPAGAILAAAVLAFGAPGAAEGSAPSLKGACGLSDETFAPWRTAVLSRRRQWLAKAEASKPALHRRAVAPVRLVKPFADAKAFQGWSLSDAGTAESALNRPLSAGEEFIFDFGEHLVGHLSLRLVDFGRAVDAPVRLLLSFAEVPSELAEDPADTNPTVSTSWYHYFAEALYAAGMRREGDALLMSYWGKMADFGADTFWEVFVPEDHRAGPYRTHLMNSYCHAWSCAPAYFLRNGKFAALGAQTR